MKTLYQEEKKEVISREEYLNAQTELNEAFGELNADRIIIEASNRALGQLQTLESLEDTNSALYDLAMETITAPIGYTNGVLSSTALEGRIKDFVNSAIQKAKDLWATIYKKVMAGIDYVLSLFGKGKKSSKDKEEEVVDEPKPADGKERDGSTPEGTLTSGARMALKDIEGKDVVNFIYASYRVIDGIADIKVRDTFNKRLAVFTREFSDNDYLFADDSVYTDKAISRFDPKVDDEVIINGFYNTMWYKGKADQFTSMTNKDRHGHPDDGDQTITLLAFMDRIPTIGELLKRCDKIQAKLQDPVEGSVGYNLMAKAIRADILKGTEFISKRIEEFSGAESFKKDLIKLGKD